MFEMSGIVFNVHSSQMSKFELPEREQKLLLTSPFAFLSTLTQ